MSHYLQKTVLTSFDLRAINLPIKMRENERKEKIIKEINKSFDESVHVCADGTYLPWVCLICDKFLQFWEVNYVTKSTLVRCKDELLPKRDLHPNVREYYTYKGEGHDENLNDCLLSPSGVFVNNKFVVCSKCKYYLERRKTTPLFAIANFFEFGPQPEVLKELTDVEIAFISEVKFHFHLISFRGGHKGIEGWHSLMKTDVKDKLRMLNSLDTVKKIPNKIYVVMYGQMTEEQRTIIKNYTKIRRDKCKEAIGWLSRHHVYYKNILRDFSLDELQDVVLLDKSKLVESVDTSIESSFEVRVTFPDGTLDDRTAGLNDINELNESVAKLLNGGDVTAHLLVSNSSYVKDFEGANFSLAFLRQFPYGYGGPQERRLISSNKSLRKLFSEEYYGHVTKLSQLTFQSSLFLLVSFNIYFRTKLMQSICWKVLGNKSFSKKIASLSVTEAVSGLHQHMEDRRKKRRHSIYQTNSISPVSTDGGNNCNGNAQVTLTNSTDSASSSQVNFNFNSNVSGVAEARLQPGDSTSGENGFNEYSQLRRQDNTNGANLSQSNIITDSINTDGGEFISLMSSVSRSMPHGEEAATKGRQNLFSMIFAFGRPTIFLTVSPPDDNSVQIIVYSGNQSLFNNRQESFSFDSLKQKSRRRSEIRFSYPGLSTLNFQFVLHLVLKHVVGWNVEREGYFGKPDAYFFTVEEQSRKTLHAHILIWIKNGSEDTIQLENPNSSSKAQREAKSRIIKYVDHIQCSELFKSSVVKIEHKCRSKRVPNMSVKDNSTLRDLRHKDGCLSHNCAPFFCRSCNSEWTSNEAGLLHALSKSDMFSSFLLESCQSKTNVFGSHCSDEVAFANEMKPQLCLIGSKLNSYLEKSCQEIILNNKRPYYKFALNDHLIVNSLYNIHSSSHVRTCFNGQNRDECRYKFPKKCVDSTILGLESIKVPIFDFNGNKIERNKVSIEPRRRRYDVFTNSHCPVISESKIACNSNVSFIVNDRIAFYVSKYVSKNTQKDDNIDYENMFRCMIRRLAEKKYESTSSESISRALCCALAHNSKNVISATLAKYLIDVGSRFGSSHVVYNIPLNEIRKVLFSQAHLFTVQISSTRKRKYSTLVPTSPLRETATTISTTNRLEPETTNPSLPLVEPVMLDTPNVPDTQDSRKCFTSSQALHYTCRPKQLEEVNTVEFFTKYYVRKKRPSDDEEDEELMDFNGEHPGLEVQNVLKRKCPGIPGINNWTIEDTSNLSGYLLDESVEASDKDEAYTLTILILFYPFRTLDDLRLNGSSVLKYRSVYKDYILPNIDILNNIQSFRNAAKQKEEPDSLEACTSKYVSSEEVKHETDEEREDGGIFEEYVRNTFFQQNDESEQIINRDPNSDTLFNLDLSTIQSRGTRMSGYTSLSPAKKTGPEMKDFVELTNARTNVDVVETTHRLSSGHDSIVYEKLTVKKVVGVLTMKITNRVFDDSDDDLEDSSEPGEVSFPVTIDDSSDPGVVSFPVTPDDAADPGEASFPVTTDVEDKKAASVTPNAGTNLQFSNNSNAKNEINEQYLYNFAQPTGTAQSIVNWSKRRKKKKYICERLDNDQRKAFIVVCSCFVRSILETVTDEDNSTEEERKIVEQELILLKGLSNKLDTVRMYLDGPGGSGKSKIVKEILKYCRGFCSLIDYPFTKYSILVTASSGVAATLIQGQTVHSACHLAKGKITNDLKDDFEDVKVIIVDEISMLSKDLLEKLDKKLRLLKDMYEYFGGVHIVFIGDFRQLKPVGSDKCTIYLDYSMTEWYDAINIYIPLKGRYRFMDDPKWGQILERFHSGVPTKNDFDIINERVIQTNTIKTMNGISIPEGTRYCTKYNKDRDAINTGLFIERLRASELENSDCLLVLADNLKMELDKCPETGKKIFMPVKNSSSFYSECGEDNIKFGSRETTRMDPVLKLYYDCPVMLTNNLDVERGLANGTEARVKKIRLKPLEKPFRMALQNITLYDYYNVQSDIAACDTTDGESQLTCNAVFASQIHEVELYSDAAPKHLQSFSLRPTNFTFHALLPPPKSLESCGVRNFKEKMQATQLPFVLNSATTCYKLQGSTCVSIVINSFNYSSNWPYVALSRVKTLNGLFLNEPLNPNKDFSIDRSLHEMKKMFRRAKSPAKFFLTNIDRKYCARPTK